MCLVLLAYDTHPEYALVLAANRDEFYDRPSAAAAFWPDAPDVLGGRDLQAGGSWLAVDRTGRFAAVTNYRQGQREPAAAHSRGHLISDYLKNRLSAREHIERIAAQASQYNGFNLLAGDTASLFYFSNREGSVRKLASGIYGLSNHLLDSAWPKVSHGKETLSALMNGTESELVDGLLAFLIDPSRPADHLLPDTGVSLPWERLLSSAFIASDDYGTRSSTVLLIARDGNAIFVEQNYSAGGVKAEQNRHTFKVRQAAA
ncbi:MAG: NRDE family protein [Pseudomonadota bacterium]|nr:NRDE family protein [Pseudomonadota bacterium]